jgi:C-terminal processing protease CtpA/Prc
MKILRFIKYSGLLFVLLFTLSSVPSVNAQKMVSIDRDRMKVMLNGIKKAIKKDYYDPNFHGINLEERFKLAEDRIEKTESVGQALAVIAQVLMDFNDSHLYFLPPATNLRVEYGWRMQMIGDKCFVTTVKPKSDAEAKGLKAGDQILAIENFPPAKKELWKVNYYYNILSKRQALRLKVLSPGAEQPREIAIESKIKQMPNIITAQNFFTLSADFSESKNDKQLFQKAGNITIWRMPSFAFDPAQVDTLMDRAAKGSSLILDLRGNGGGYVETLERLAGFFFDKDVKIADLKGRKEMKPMQCKTRAKDIFKGNIIVLIDADSGSASEIFARLIQIEKRGKVLGDVSAGAVMQATGLDEEITTGGIFYGASITNADVIMTDGKSVEHIGVTPDEIILKTGEDLLKQRDPVLSRAVELLGGQLSAEQAGKFFLYEWKD